MKQDKCLQVPRNSHFTENAAAKPSDKFVVSQLVDNRASAHALREMQLTADKRPPLFSLSPAAPVQRVLLPDVGNAAAEDKQQAAALLQDLVANVPAIAAMRNHPHIRIGINVSRSEDGGDTETHATWDDPNTAIIINLDMAANETADMIKANLLHELVLHAIPAGNRHIAAVNLGAAPAHAVDDDDIEEEETIEHGDILAWRTMIGHAARHGNPVRLEARRDAVRHMADFDSEAHRDFMNELLDLIEPEDPDFAEVYREDAEGDEDQAENLGDDDGQEMDGAKAAGM